MQRLQFVVGFAAALAFTTPLQGQDANAVSPGSAISTTGSDVKLPDGYVIGPDDVLGVLFWREDDMSSDATVRPDGMITLPLVGDIRAAGLSPEVLKTAIEKEAARYLTEPTVTVLVREVNSRKVFITGEVAAPGEYPLTGPRTVMQLIALAGGLNEYADSKDITVMRIEGRTQRAFKFNYNDVARGRALQQNILLQPGDTVVVP